MFKSILAVIVGLGVASARAQEVVIPDPGLNAAIREALQIPAGPLTTQDLLGLTQLNAGGRNIRSVVGLEAARNLRILDLDGNSLTNFPIADALPNLTILDLFHNDLTSFVLSNPPPNLAILDLAFNSLSQCSLPGGLTNLGTLFLEHNALADFELPAGLAQLTQLDLSANQLNVVTLPVEVSKLTALFVDDNPLASLVLPEPLTNRLAVAIAALRERGVEIFAYPLDLHLVRPHSLVGAFQFTLAGPPGNYAVLDSSDLLTWYQVGQISNQVGKVNFTDGTAHGVVQRYYRAHSMNPPADMVFVPPATFTMGSPTNEQDRNVNEGPQTVVTLTRGFWIGKFEVTQGEYLSLMNTNPSFFPGDLRRPISSVSWFDATNYCDNLTVRERAAGRISSSSRYRLPTEAEWEWAARAGTTTRFSYGDDPDYSSLTNHAWYSVNGELIVHSVGLKRPNPRGLYDMEGNVWEWCQDWLGPLPGGAVTDPEGPASNPIGLRIVRGGAYDFAEPDCRSARRSSFPAHPVLADSDIGFRVVLEVQEP